MSNELVKASPVSVPDPGTGPDLPSLVERAGITMKPRGKQKTVRQPA
jgi:hypothetical protein